MKTSIVRQHRFPMAGLFLCATACLISALAAAAPFNLYLTYPEDPSTSISVHFSVEGRLSRSAEGVVKWDTVSRGGEPGAYAHQTVTLRHEITNLAVDRTLHRAPLLELQPDTVYYFVAGDETGGFSEERSFRTIPNDDRPLRFVTGGDLGVTPAAERLLALAGKQDPLFCAIGGDLAYVNGQVWQYRTWDRWFQNYDTNMRTSEGHMIPILAGIGNHETNRLETDIASIKAPFFTAFFGLSQADGKTYFMRRFGKHLAFLVLDTGHIAPHAGEQAAWLAETLAANQNVPYRFAMYHVPLYPSHRPFEGEGSRLGRVHWEPYFNAFGLTTAFENHDHTLKRSVLLKNGQPSADGILYLGDGSFGIGARTVDNEIRPYLEYQQGVSHIWVVDVKSDGITYEALGEAGESLDKYSHQPNK